ncbi:MAG: aminopeptidase P family protein [Acidimicrobiia bacterium]|nr:aminopeptidase P family protein [Acidimicrobiia bacterium]MYA40129.1 aminopeptidase P family protein [Acidimicrobiia bacterium]MYH06959.1 aminopeptidase P family protein [Acidimicrobiia bacterium]MYK55685.1 aminopeptidase P family protein [Acidimicrobiia bacterium]
MSLYEPTYMEGTLGTMAVDWEERINMARMRDERKARAQHQIAEAGLGSVLLLDDPNIRYVTGLAMLGGSGADHYSFLTTGGDVVHWDTADHASNERANCPWLPDIRYAAPGLGNVPRASGSPSAREFLLDTMADLIVEAAHDYDVHRDPIGIDSTQPALARKLSERGLDVREGAADALHTARQTKTKDEIECFRVLSAICEAGFMAIKKAAEPGMLEQEVWGAAVEAVLRRGGTVEGGYLTSGPNTWPKHQANTTDRMLRPGDIMYADFYSATFQGYRSCVYRTFSIGKPEQRSIDAYKRARDWMYNVIEAIRPGVTTGEVAMNFPNREGERMDWYGAKDYWEMTTNQWAHGLGLQLYERPLIWRGISVDHPIEIQEGMVMAVETQEPDGQSGMRVEEMIVVRETGAEVLTRWPVDEITVIDF